MEIRAEQKGQEKKNQRSATKKLWYYVGYLSVRGRVKTEHPSYGQNSQLVQS
jgi:hypothetical protein